MGVEHKLTSAYHPRSNGLTERFNRTLIEALKKHCQTEPKHWHKWIPYVLMSHRCRINPTTNYTPFELMFGRKMNKFTDYNEKHNKNESIEERAAEIKKLVEEDQPRTVERLREKQEKQKEVQNDSHNITEKQLQIGDKVYIRNMRINKKCRRNLYALSI